MDKIKLLKQVFVSLLVAVLMFNILAPLQYFNASTLNSNLSEVVNSEVKDIIEEEQTKEEVTTNDNEKDITTVTTDTNVLKENKPNNIKSNAPPGDIDLNAITNSDKEFKVVVLTQKEINKLKETKATFTVNLEAHPSLDRTDFATGGSWGQLLIHLVNGEYVFCIEPKEDVTSTAYEISESESVYSTFSASLKEQINNITAYGMKFYKETGNKDYLYATQLLIWKAINPGDWSVDGGTSLQPEINKIRDMVVTHKNLPSFMRSSQAQAMTYKLKWNVSNNRYEVTLTDTNAVANYKLSDLNGKVINGYHYELNGDKLIVWSSEHNINKQTLDQKYIPYISTGAKFYEGGQDLVQTDTDPLPMFMNLETEVIRGKVEIKKTGHEYDDTYETLKDVEFTVYLDKDSNGSYETEVTKLYTDNKGYVLSDWLYYGKYKVVETDVKDNYFANFSETININKPGDLTYKLNNGDYIINEKITGQFKLIKVKEIEEKCPYNQDLMPINGKNTTTSTCYKKVLAEGVKFNLYEDLNKNGILEDYEEKNAPMTPYITDLSGLISVDGLDTTKDYILREVDVPAEYQPMEDKVLAFSKLTPNDKGIIDLGTFDVVNEFIKNDIEITKTDLGTGKELPGAKIEVYNDNGDVVESWTSTNNAHKFKLRYGKYSICETMAPTGYQKLDQCVSFKVTTNGLLQKFKLENELIKNRIEVTKTDFATGEELPGAKIEVYDNKGNVVEAWTSTNKAHVFELTYGKYSMCETVAPNGYEKLDQCVSFSVTTQGVVQKFKIENKLIAKTLKHTGFDGPIILIIILLLLAIALIVIRKFVKSDNNDDNATDRKMKLLGKPLIIIISIVFLANVIILVLRLSKGESMDIIGFIATVATSLFTTGLATLLIWFWAFKELPDTVSDQVRSEMEKISGKDGNLSNEHNVLSKDHSELRKEHEKIEQQIVKYGEPLYEDLLIKKAFNEKSGHTISKLENTISKIRNDDEKIQSLNKKIFALQDQNNNLKDKVRELEKENEVLKPKQDIKTPGFEPEL